MAEGSEEHSTRCLLLFFLPIAMAIEFGAIMIARALSLTVCLAAMRCRSTAISQTTGEGAVADIETIPASRHSRIVSPVY
jgi:hypothetical protein